MNFAREPYSDSLIAEMRPLWDAHWQEIAHYRDIALDPDFNAYANIDKLGRLRIFTARLSGVLVGYQWFIVSPHPHYRQSLQAVQDILFISPTSRKGLTGLRLIRWCDRALKAEGVQVVYQHVKAAHDIGPVLERIGYQKQDVIYSRRLDLWQ